MPQQRKPTVMVPTAKGPAGYGTPESAQELSSVWGMKPEEAYAIMLQDSGKLDPKWRAEPDYLEVIKALMAASKQVSK